MAVAAGDFDNDGFSDNFVALNGPAKLFRNVSAGIAHCVALKLRGTHTNRQGLGATVHLVLPDGRSLYNQATTTFGYGNSSEALVRFGLGTHPLAKRIEIHWPGGRTQTITDVAAIGLSE
jgi:enediyne biosynthesis protein E4